MVLMFVRIKKNPINFMKTCSLYAALIIIGIGWTIIGPTLLDLKTRELKEVTIVVPSASCGSTLGSVIMKFIFEKVYITLMGHVVVLFSFK